MQDHVMIGALRIGEMAGVYIINSTRTCQIYRFTKSFTENYGGHVTDVCIC